MKLPESPPSLAVALQGLTAERTAALLNPVGLHPEVNGRYLHWDEARHRPAPSGLTHADWWLRLSLARAAVRTPLPLADKGGENLHFSRTDSLLRLLYFIDREMGSQLEVSDPKIANQDVRDRYIIRSLAEEAITSSQLEGAATTRKVAKEMLLSGRSPRNRDERMIANNFQAMEYVRRRKDERLSIDFILELHQLLTEHTLDDEGEAGRFRRPDENVVVQEHADGTVLHIPPPAAQLPARLGRLCDFANSDDDHAPFIHPVIRAVVLHFALAYDHPFVDGNGRTARALFYWCMLRHGYWIAEFISISRILQRGASQYGRAFLHSETDNGDITYFVLHQLEVLKHAIEDLHVYLRQKAEEVREAEKLIKANKELNHRQQMLIAHALRHPSARYTMAAYAREYGVVYATARADLLGLASAGYLNQTKVGRAFYFSPSPARQKKKRR